MNVCRVMNTRRIYSACWHVYHWWRVRKETSWTLVSCLILVCMRLPTTTVGCPVNNSLRYCITLLFYAGSHNIAKGCGYVETKLSFAWKLSWIWINFLLQWTITMWVSMQRVKCIACVRARVCMRVMQYFVCVCDAGTVGKWASYKEQQKVFTSLVMTFLSCEVTVDTHMYLIFASVYFTF